MYSRDELFLCSGNKHKNNPPVSAETDRHSSAYIIFSIYNAKIMMFACIYLITSI